VRRLGTRGEAAPAKCSLHITVMRPDMRVGFLVFSKRRNLRCLWERPIAYLNILPLNKNTRDFQWPPDPGAVGASKWSPDPGADGISEWLPDLCGVGTY
jgi:hypothetical protein